MPRSTMLILLASILAACGTAAEPARQQASSGDVAQSTIAMGDAKLPAPTTPEARAAVVALEEGRPWRATLALAPLTRDPARRTPDALLIAAVAAARWEGWRTVTGLLNGAPWLDSLADAAGRALLARATLELGDATTAATHAKLAVAATADKRAKAERQVILARALDRIDDREGARDAYLAAAQQLPLVEDWLQLRAAGVTGDDGARKTLLSEIELPVAQARRTMTDAQARERAGDRAGAAEAFAKAGSMTNAMRLRLALADDDAARTALRTAVFEEIARRSGTTEARSLVALADSQLAPLSPAEELIAARSAAASGPAARAADGFARALAASLGGGDDWMKYGDVLFRLARYDRAATAFARVTGDDRTVARAGYQRGRSLLRAGLGTQGTRVLTDVATRYASQSAAADALYLLADISADDKGDAAARAGFLDVARKHPSSAVAPRALYRAALSAQFAGDSRTAAAEFDKLAAQYPKSGERAGALYWAGRALASRDAAAARGRWQRVIADSPMSYYAMLAARRLNQPAWAPVGAPATPNLPDAVAALRRAKALDALGMDVEARFELNALDDNVKDAPALVALAGALSDNGYTSRAVGLAKRALAAGAERDATLMALLYPEPFGEALEAESRARKLDADLVASLVRQESTFEPRARSPADARGLMQVMPKVGESIARGLRFPVWDVALLYQPDVNLQLGTAHLASLLKEYGGRKDYALAAYNAGGSRVTRWRRLPGTADSEVFVERIPFEETREYVQVVLRGQAVYASR